METLEEKVSALDFALLQLSKAQYKTELVLQQLGIEMREFKDEIKEDTKKLKEEMVKFKNDIGEDTKRLKEEMVKFKNEIGEDTKKLKEEMAKFKDDIREDTKKLKEDMQKETKKMNKQWGHLANKMGTIVEDIIFPATRAVLKKYFCDPEILMMNVERKKGDKNEECDVIGVCDKKVFLIEVKSTLKGEYINLVKEKVKRFKDYFEEYKDYEVVPIFASLRIKDEFLKRLTKEKIYALAYKEWEYMDILNFKEING